jgi:hypothetical protein
MGHHLRKLAVLCAVSALGVAGPIASAHATTAMVRVETPAFASSFSTLVDRQRVTLGTDPVIKAGQSCSPDSPAAALTAAIGADGWDATYDPAATPNFRITRIKNVSVPATSPTWRWSSFVSTMYMDDPCHKPIPDGNEALFAPSCFTTTPVQQSACFTGGPLQMQIGTASPLEIAPISVAGHDTPVSVQVFETPFTPNATGGTQGNFAGSSDSVVSTDEGVSAVSKDDHRDGFAVIHFSNYGDHIIRATENGKIPVRANVCATDGQDGFCGTTKPDFNPFVTPPSPCDTTGHDGFCGTTDTSGPVAHVTNILNKQVFKKGKGPGKVKGTLDVDPNGVGTVKMRLTRVSTGRVRIKAKKSRKSKKKAKVRYRTVKRCTAWDDGTALLVTAKCGTKYAKWFPGDLTDLRDGFDYSFAMTLPSGTYTLEVSATDEDGHVDAPAPGRNVLTFTVK